MTDIQAYNETEQFNRLLAVVEALKRAEPIPAGTRIVECYVGINSLITAYEEGEIEEIQAHMSDVLDNCNLLPELNIYFARLVCHKWPFKLPYGEGLQKFLREMSRTIMS